MIISVASGKGGTGKTLVATSLALSMKDKCNVQLLDCDVNAADLHLMLSPSSKEENELTKQKTDSEKGICSATRAWARFSSPLAYRKRRLPGQALR